MSTIQVDARGFACPEPMLMAKQAMDQGYDQVEILVDSSTAMENIKRYAAQRSSKLDVIKKEQEYSLLISK